MKTTLSGHADSHFKHAVGLSAVWQNRLLEVYGPDSRMLVPKEHGQLGRLRKSLGMKQATEVVEYAIRNWGNFAQKAAKNVESDIVPPKPSVGWLYQYHATAVLMLHEDLQSIAKKQAGEEQAKKEAQANEAKKAMQELKSTKPSVTLIHLTAPEQINAWCDPDDPHNQAFIDEVTEKYGVWRPAVGSEKGIPCDIEFKK
jgi:hypothetical protein